MALVAGVGRTNEFERNRDIGLIAACILVFPSVAVRRDVVEHLFGENRSVIDRLYRNSVARCSHYWILSAVMSSVSSRLQEADEGDDGL